MAEADKHDAPSEEEFEVDAEEEIAVEPEEEPRQKYSGNVEVARYDPNEPTVSGFHDHFTLSLPSSTVRYREAHSAARIIESSETQFILEEIYDAENNKHNVSIRRIHDTSEGVRFLRIIYVIVAAFFLGFLFVFCLMVLLFLFLDLAIQVGATSQQSANWRVAMGVIFSFIPFVYGLASALVIGGAFIQDTWSGHTLIRNFAFRNMDAVTFEWVFFGFFLGFPILVFCITLLARTDWWWSITSLFWFCCVLAFYIIFAVNVIFYEMRACWEVSQNRYKHDVDTSWQHIKRSIHLRQIATYSGRKDTIYLSIGSIQDSEYTDKSTRENMIESTHKEEVHWRAKITLLPFLAKWGLYENLAEAERVYSIDDARDVRPYLTTFTWSLEKVFCRPRDSRYIAILNGPGAVTRSQMKSSMICSFIGTFLIFLVLLSILVFFKFGGAFTTFILFAGLIISYPSLKSAYNLYKVVGTMAFAKKESERRNSEISSEPDSERPKESEAMYLVKESYRITRPTRRFCYITFFTELGLLFIWPLVSLFVVGNWPLAITFIVVAGISGLRYYINAAVVLEETGHMNLVGGNDEAELWRNQSRLNEIIGNITRGRSRRAWMAVLGLVGFIFLGLFVGAIGTEQAANVSDQQTADSGYTYLNDFYYKQKDSLRYPTCQLTSDLGDSPLTSMADYAFLAGLAYRPIGLATQTELDGWFGDDPDGTYLAQEQVETVQDYRNSTGVSSAVSFKLITFPNSGNYAYVLIRGTQTNWDMLADAQLWAAAALMQVHRLLLPFGAIWTPIMDQLINAITTVESESINRVSFYKDTTRFVNFIKDQTGPGNAYAGVGITGHSLGGGLSMISGAQTGTPAIALSGPNSMLSRKSFDPKVTAEQLDSNTFNIIPARDVVPMIDDRAQNFQEIRCEAGLADFIGCHDSTRSLCEIIWSCGTNNRPAICECVTMYGYQEPIQNGTLTFKEACGLE